MTLDQSTIGNRLLATLHSEDFERLAPHLEPIDLPKDFEIARMGQPHARCYLPSSGIGSIVAITPEGQRAEVGMVGREGVLPIAPLLYSGFSSSDIVMQVAGYGHSISCEVLQDLVAERPGLRSVFMHFVQTLSTQTSYTALSNAVHHVEERLARWILMCHDRADNGTIALTHDYISVMLAVRRPSVTTALHVLEGNKLIYSERGLITIRDREALQSFAADAYGMPEREYARLIGSMRP